MDNAQQKFNEFRERMATDAHVRNLMEDEFEILERGHQPDDEEPVVTFSVRLPVGDLGRMERIGAYFGHKKTPFASMLLSAAIEDAWWGLLQAAEERGKREEVAEFLQQRHELEDGNGYTQIKGGSSCGGSSWAQGPSLSQETTEAEGREGTTVYYLSPEDQESDGDMRGFFPFQANGSPALIHQFSALPGEYEVKVGRRPGARGKATEVVTGVEFVREVSLQDAVYQASE